MFSLYSYRLIKALHFTMSHKENKLSKSVWNYMFLLIPRNQYSRHCCMFRKCFV